ncbi:MAG: HD domain-containing protein [Planctomycetaceae bacterium]|nr:HD domain-containing protein [Planctomycetaceae bacterium]
MTHDTLKRQIVVAAAQLIHRCQEHDYDRARSKAVRKLGLRWVRREELPSHAEIRHELLMLAYQQECEFDALYGEASASRGADATDRFQVYRSLLLPLADTRQSRRSHPEGDALYHSLQVFELARDELPYDEEFLLAALLHDIGKAIDSKDHIAAGLAALDGWITERTAWLIAHHAEARRIHDGTIGARARRRLAASESFEELLLLAECDRDGRIPGMVVADLDEALDDIREVSQLCG